MNQEQFEEIEQYLTGKMASDEKAAFEERIASNFSLRKEVDAYKMLIDGVQEKALRDQLDAFHREVDSVDPAVKRPIRRLSGIQRYSIAASIIVVLGIGFWLIRNQTSADQRLFKEYFQPDPGLMTPMSTSFNYEFYRGMVDYKQGKYSSAIERWEVLRKQKPENDTLRYYLGVAWLAEGDASQAIQFLDWPDDLQSVFNPDRYFYLGMAYLKNDQPKQAKEALYRSGLTDKHPLIQALE